MKNSYVSSKEMVIDSRHSFERAKERAGLSRKRAEKMMSLAKQRGITSKECKWSSDRRFLERKSSDSTEAVAYNGYCFILSRVSLRCITMFALPKDFGKKKTKYAVSGRAMNREERREFQFEFAY